MHHPQESKTTFPKALADVILRHKATTYKETFINKRKLHKRQKQNQQLEYEEQWPIPDTQYDTLRKYLKLKRVIHCNPMTLPLRAKEYKSYDPRDATFGLFHTLKLPGLTLP
jgi:hypothetical protein